MNDTLITEAARELREIAITEKELAARKERLKHIIREATQAGDKIADPTTGEILAVVRAGQKRFSPDLCREALPEQLYKSILSLQPDKGIAKDILPPVLYEACCTVSDNMVVPQ